MNLIAAAGVHLRTTLPSGRALLALIPVFVVLGGLIVYCLVDLIRAPRVRYLPKPVWALIILLVSAPFGASAYLVFGKDRGDHAINTVADADADAGQSAHDQVATTGP